MSGAVDLRQLRYFVVIAELENFNRAAERLHIAQPALSRHVRALEADLGTPLFERLTRGVRLTAAGRALAERSRGILAEVEAAREFVANVGQGLIGRLALGFNSIAVRNAVVPEALRRFRLGRPEVRLTMRTAQSSDQIRMIHAQELDVGFLYFPPDAHSNLEFLEIAPYKPVVALLRTHRLGRRSTLRMKDLREEHFIWISRQRLPWIHDQLIAQCLAHGYSPKIVQEADDAESQLSLVSVGLGVGFAHPTQAPPTPDVVFKKIPDLSLVWPLYMCWRRDDSSAIVAAFVNLVRQVLRSSRRPRN